MDIPELVERSLQRYSALLGASVGDLSPATREARTALHRVVAGSLRGVPVHFDATEYGALCGELGNLVQQVAATPCTEKARLLNPLTLGVGAPRPEWIFLGYEAAYALGEEPNFTLEACLLSALWRAEAGGLEFRQHPYNLYRRCSAIAGRMNGSGHYWRKISELTGAREQRWGETAYLIEICADPARAHAAGTVSEERIAFLRDLMRQTEARVLVVARRKEHRACKESVARAFLRVDRLPAGESVRIPNGRREVATDFLPVGGRLVVFTRHLSNDVSHEFLEALRSEIARHRA